MLKSCLKASVDQMDSYKCGDWQIIFEKLTDMDKNQIWELDSYSMEYMTKRMDNNFGRGSRDLEKLNFEQEKQMFKPTLFGTLFTWYIQTSF